MTPKVAVAVIHGIGSQAGKRPPISSHRTFSERLHKPLRRRLGRRVMERDVAWREIFWADILEPRQEDYLRRTAPQTRWNFLRRPVVNNLADAVAFQRRGARDQDAYYLLMDRVRAAIRDLGNDTSDDTPLVLLAHSFGGRILSNYIWDLQQGLAAAERPFERLETVAAFVTFGCNLPLFTFAFPPEEVEPIALPGPALDPEEVREPWWLNFYDPDDVLAYPIAPIGERYQALSDRGELRDVAIDTSGFFRAKTPFSHDLYWNAPQFVKPVAARLRALLGAAS